MKAIRTLFLWSFFCLFFAYIPAAFAGSGDSPSIASIYDNAWDTQFILQALNGPVHAIIRNPDGGFYVGGEFTAAGALPVNGIAKWDGSSWSAVGSGISGGDFPRVLAMAMGKNGELFVGGQFTKAGDKKIQNIAKWESGSWSALNLGINGPVRSLAVAEDGTLYAGGSFNAAGGTVANNIATWNNGSWAPLGDGVQGSTGPSTFVNTIVIKGTTLYVGGQFSKAGENSIYSVASWNGSTWSSLGPGIATNSVVYALVVKGSDIYVAGNIPNAGGTIAVNNIARWNGTDWSAVGALNVFNNNILTLSLSSTGDLIAGGDFTNTSTATVNHIAQWNGIQWSSLGKGMDNAVLATIDDTDGSLYAGGNFVVAGGQVAGHFARWKNSAWSLPSSTPNTSVNGNIYAMVADNNNNIYVGGDFIVAGTTTTANIARWNGTQWSVLGKGLNAPVHALAIAPNGNIYAGGEFTMADGTTANYVAKWDGTRWRPLGNGTDGPVYAIGTQGTDVYIGGDFITAGNTSANRIARWDGTEFRKMLSGLGAEVHAITVYNGDIYVGGAFSLGESKVARWHNSQWEPMLDSMNGPVHTLAFGKNGELYAGGEFTSAGSKALAQHIAVWNNQKWQPLGTGMDSVVYTITITNQGRVIAGGNFSQAGSTPVAHIASWYNGLWLPLASGVDNQVRSLLSIENDLFVGGDFTMAGNHSSHKIARWKTCPPFTINASGPLTFCLGDSVVLDAGAGYQAYLWNTGVTTQTLTVAKAGIYAVTIAGDQCNGVSAPVTVTTRLLPTVQVSKDTTICQGNGVQLLGTATGGTLYSWFPPEGLSCLTCVGPLATPTQTTTYFLTVKDVTGCSGVDSVVITVRPAPVTPVITQQNDILSTQEATGYQWFYGSALIDGATGQNYTPSKSGTYTVQTSNADGCTSMSAPFTVTLSGIREQTDLAQISLHPNPASETILLEIPGMTQPVSVEIVNVLGITVQHLDIQTSHTVLDIHTLATGAYSVRMQSGHHTWVHSFMKQ